MIFDAVALSVRLRTNSAFGYFFVKLEEFSWGEPIAPYHSQRKATIREAIAQRLRRVCADLPETEFQQLVDEMADKQLRGERRLSDL